MEGQIIEGYCHSKECFIMDGYYQICDKWGKKSLQSAPLVGGAHYSQGQKAKAQAAVDKLNADLDVCNEFKLKPFYGKRMYPIMKVINTENTPTMKNHKTEICVGVCNHCNKLISTIRSKEPHFVEKLEQMNE